MQEYAFSNQNIERFVVKLLNEEKSAADVAKGVIFSKEYTALNKSYENSLQICTERCLTENQTRLAMITGSRNFQTVQVEKKCLQSLLILQNSQNCAHHMVSV